jgi:uncharacterized membrane protein
MLLAEHHVQIPVERGITNAIPETAWQKISTNL